MNRNQLTKRQTAIQTAIRALSEQLSDPTLTPSARSQLIVQRTQFAAMLDECNELLAVTP
jgi:hypothetical protein